MPVPFSLWVAQTSTNQDSLVRALKETPYVYYGGHGNDGAGFALKVHAADPDFDPHSVHGIDDFMHLRNPQVAIPWRQLHDDLTEYPNFGPGAVPSGQIPAHPTNYAVTIPFSKPIIDGYNHANNERYPNNPASDNTHVGAGGTFPAPSGTGIAQHHMTRRTDPSEDSGGGNLDFLVVDVDNSVKPKFGYKIFCAFVCNGARDYGEVFNHGCFISTTDYSSSNDFTPYAFVRALVEGGGPQEIIGRFNGIGSDDITQTNH